jgi:hypothetical protein
MNLQVPLIFLYIDTTVKYDEDINSSSFQILLCVVVVYLHAIVRSVGEGFRVTFGVNY